MHEDQEDERGFECGDGESDEQIEFAEVEFGGDDSERGEGDQGEEGS